MRIRRLLEHLGIPLAVALGLAGQYLLSLKGTPWQAVIPGIGLYVAAAALLLLGLRAGTEVAESGWAHRIPQRLEWSLLALVLLAGLYLRLERIDLIPWGLNNDEAINALESQEILDGRPFSTLTQRGLNRETMFHYLAALAYRNPGLGLNVLRAMPAVFGIQPGRISSENQLSDLIFPLRSVAIGAGTLTLLAIYLFARRHFGWRVALLASILMAVSPWHLLYSRVGERAILAPLFALVTLDFFLRALESARLLDHLAWGAALGLGLWTYTSFRAIPLALAGFLLVRRFIGPDRRALPAPGRRAFLAGGGLAALILVLLIARSPIGVTQFLLRGSYVTLPPKTSLGLNLLHALTMINYFPARYAVVQSQEFISDGISTTFGLIGLEPESIVTAALATLGILYAAWRVWRRRDAACLLLLLCFLALGLTVGLAGPSLTRMLLNLPWLCLFASLLAWRLFDDLAGLRRPFTVWLAAAALLGLASTTCVQGYRQYFLRAGSSSEAMQNFGATQTIMGMFVRSLPPDQEIYVLHTLRVDTLTYLIGDRPEVHLVTDPSSLDYNAIIHLPKTVTFVVEYARLFAEPMRLLVTRYPQGEMSQIADARLNPDKTIFFVFTLWKDENGQPLSPPGARPPS
jgi:Dolichyl-phosphate-mannose-protein mannosyltransferase